jgi:hypothetical protein
LRKISLREAWIEFERQVDGRQCFVVLTRQAQRPSEGTVTKAIKLVERHGDTSLAQCRFQSRRAIFWIVIKRALNIDVSERAMAACEIRIRRDRTLKIALGRVKSRYGKSP